jgi:tRNA threonylcarbamoyladenosine modification (KEOPS) complex  Pcc1 subunit
VIKVVSKRWTRKGIEATSIAQLKAIVATMTRWLQYTKELLAQKVAEKRRAMR